MAPWCAWLPGHPTEAAARVLGLPRPQWLQGLSGQQGTRGARGSPGKLGSQQRALRLLWGREQGASRSPVLWALRLLTTLLWPSTGAGGSLEQPDPDSAVSPWKMWWAVPGHSWGLGDFTLSMSP